jgi:hypothetical protein
MLNNPMGSAGLVKGLGADRVVLGFPGAGGTLEGHVVRYAFNRPTTDNNRRTLGRGSIMRRTKTDNLILVPNRPIIPKSNQ